MAEQFGNLTFTIFFAEMMLDGAILVSSLELRQFPS